MKIGFIGIGKLGLPCAEVMAQHHDVTGYDVVPTKSESVKVVGSYQEAVEGKDIIFVAVPTPHSKEYGGESPIAGLEPKDFNYDIVKSVLKAINPFLNKEQLVVLISTTLPGTVRKQLAPLISNARFVYNPYLIAMGSVKWDMVNPEMIVIGTEFGELSREAQELESFYKPIMQNNPRVVLGTWDEAESIKIFYNTFISAKIGLVNMILDVAEKNGNINVDVVTDALKNSTQRIMGPRYMRAGMGDSGACHPRDNIALRWLSKNLNLGYDLFDAIMQSRDVQAKNMAMALIANSNRRPIVIHGKAYKPLVSYTEGSYSLLIGGYLQEYGFTANYADPLTGDVWDSKEPAIFLMAHSAATTYSGTGVVIPGKYQFYCDVPVGSMLVDPWRELPLNIKEGVTVIHYGNTRMQ